MIDAFTRCGLFKNIEQAALEPLKTACKTRSLKAGDVLFAEGERGDAVWCVASGVVMLTRRVKTDDLEVNLPIIELGEGELLGVQILLSDRNRTDTATAKEDSELVEMPVEELDAILKTWPSEGLNAFYHNVIVLLSMRVKGLADAQAALYLNGLNERNQAQKDLEKVTKKFNATQKLVKKMLEESSADRKEVEDEMQAILEGALSQKYMF